MRISAAAIRTHSECSLRWRWQTIDMDRDALSERDTFHGWRFGKAVHGILEDVYGWAKTQAYVGPGSSPEVMARVDESLPKRCADEDVVDREDEAFEMVADFLMETHLDGHNVVDAEMFGQWHTPAGHRVIGFMDLVERVADRRGRGIRVRDWKARTVEHADPSDAENSEQGRIYTIMIARMMKNLDFVEFRLEYLGSRNFAAVTRRGDEIPWVEADLGRRWDQAAVRMQSPPYDPSEGPWCRTCPFTDICPAKGGTVPVGLWDPVIGEVRAA